ncbi:MAG: cohesin domain-containing protein, partial [Candidatus Neomarinimicrobiota bacterium]
MSDFLHLADRFRSLVPAVGLLFLSGQSLGAQASPEPVEWAGPDSARIVLALPHITVPADTDTVMVPVELYNEWDEVGGLQVDLYHGEGVPILDSVLSTDRTPGWRIDRLQLPRAGSSRILVFDPAGSNIAPGVGPVMRLVFIIPRGTASRDYVPLSLEAVIVSDPIGSALPARGQDGALNLGKVVELIIGEAQADQGERADLSLRLSNTGPVVGIQLSLWWEPDLLEPLDVVASGRLDKFQLEWEPADSGIWIWLYAQAGKEMGPGAGEILEIAFAVDSAAYRTDIGVYAADVRVMEREGQERLVSRTIPGRMAVFPGYLDPPRNLVALSGQDGVVPLSWAAPTDGGVGKEPILLVDDDASQLGLPYLDVGGQMADDLTSAGYAFDYFSVPVGADGPDREALQHVDIIIWMTGYEWGYHPTLTPNDQANLAAFLKRGGRVWLIGQDIIWDIGPSFISRYFGARIVAEDAGTPEALTGSDGSFMDGIEYPATPPRSEMDYGDAITTSHAQARGLVSGLTHLGAVGQHRTAFWALEYGFILGRMDRIDGIRRQLAAFGVKPGQRPGIGRILTPEHPSVYAPRALSSIKAEAVAQGYRPTAGSLTPIPAPAPLIERQVLPVTGYAIYRDLELPVPRGRETLLVTVGADNLAYLDTAVVNGQTYGYAVTAIYDGQFESGPSNGVAATPVSWVDFAVGQTRALAGDEVAIPISMKNDDPVAGIRFEFQDIPPGLLTNPRVVLGDHVPPDWIFYLERDTPGESWSVVGFSPRLTTIPPREGTVLLLLMDVDAMIPAKVNLDVGEVVISDAHGGAYSARVAGGAVAIEVQLAQLRVGTGAPTQPGDTGYVSIFMDNPRPVMAFQLVIRAASDALQVVEVRGTPRLPADAHVAHTGLGKGALRLIESSFSNTPISVGRGPVVTIAYRVLPEAPEGLIGLDLEEVVLSDERGHTLRQTTVAGSFPVGVVRGVFAPAASEAEPGRTVTVPVGLTNSVNLCGFQMTAGYDPRWLTFLSSEAQTRLPRPERLSAKPIDSGQLQLHYATGDEGLIPAG